MSFDAIFLGGQVIDGQSVRLADVAVSDGKIALVSQRLDAAQARDRIDCAGLLLMPGLVDAHAHLREPGLTHKEDFASGSAAALLGGVTTVLVMPTDDPYTTTAEEFDQKADLARGRIHVDIGLQVAVRREWPGDLSELRRRGAVSFEIFTADVPAGYCHQSLADVVASIKAVAAAGGLAGVSPGDQSLLDAWSALAESERRSVESFAMSRPPLAEQMGIASAVLAAAQTGCRVHIRQVNSRLGVDMLRRLQGMANVSAETTVQCLFFDQGVYDSQGAMAKGSPPFRTRQDVEALREAVRTGLISIVATDHAPHTIAEKLSRYEAFADIPGGMPGLQTLLPAMLKLVAEGILDLGHVARLCAEGPADRFGLFGSKGRIEAGYDADIVLIDPSTPMRISNSDQRSKASYTLFDGIDVPASIRAVYLRGMKMVDCKQIVGRPAGRILDPMIGRTG